MQCNNINSTGEISKCTGCQFCEAVCPVGAINISLDKEGFYKPIVNDKCVNCGLCKKYCFKYHAVDFSQCDDNQLLCYSAKAKNKMVLEKSSSGGVLTVIFKQLIYEGYKILGVGYDYEQNISKYYILNSVDDLYQIQGSKYMQAKSGEALLNVLSSINEKCAIIGTPCLMYTISNYLNERCAREKFVLIDFFCHGTPTINLWKKYIRKYGDKFDSIFFRDKTYGWHEYSNTFVSGNKSITNKATDDEFFSLFFDDQLLNESCYGCKYRDSLSQIDIRVGDFWGNKYDHDSEGVSAMLLTTQKGRDIFDKIKEQLYFEKVTFNEIVASQAYKKEYRFNKEIRNKYLKMLRQDSYDIAQIYSKYKKDLPFTKKVKMFAKNNLKRYIPKNLYMFIRRAYHRNNEER